MHNSKTYPEDTIEFMVNKVLGQLVRDVKEKLYTQEFKKSPEFNTEETELDVVGVIISKYCDWDVDAIESIAMSAFEDSNYPRVRIEFD